MNTEKTRGFFETWIRNLQENCSAKSLWSLLGFNANVRETQSTKNDFVPIEIMMFEIGSEIRDLVTQLYAHLEAHFRHRDLELLTYQNTINELTDIVELELELERKLLRQEWESIKTAAADPDKFFTAVEHYLSTTTHDISAMERMLDAKYDLDADRNSLFFIRCSENDSEAIRADLEVLQQRSRGISIS